ncbi:uncharacterized protein L203_105670 [Cryptococcus depauperatus CBS 7841]|uniref:Uncharacterized protein n=1 Tax=Cryptococcus depauperatus CBS 7841 TaxID=1295531 RepID=A0A1E3IFA3_9TREE|nr:metal iron transporter [Cryptococcus depauperatus CBS 7841]
MDTSQAQPGHSDQVKQPGLAWWKTLTIRKCKRIFLRHVHFIGPGLVSSVAYIDPGNWATDLAAGADYGYKLLFIVLLAGLAAVVLQLLAVRLGTTTSLSLPAQTRQLFLRLQHRYPRYKIPLTVGLWSLYLLAELAIIATDLAELLGSAIALHLLFPKLPLFAGVLVTAADVLIVLLFFRSNSGRQGMMLFEIVIVSLVLAVFISFMILLKLINPVWKDVFLGLVPSKTLVKPGALYVGVGIIGATVMPHALFLGSFLAGVDRLNMIPRLSIAKKPRNVFMPSLNPFRRRTSCQPQLELGDVHLSENSRRGMGPEQEASSQKNLSLPAVSPMDKEEMEAIKAQKEYERELKIFDRIRWVDVHLFHSTIDTTLSLLGFALTINASILTLAGAAFYYNEHGDTNEADLFGAFALIKSYIGHAAAIIFALALLCAGQSASITATLAGQVVSEGFIDWKTSPFVRRLITRLLGVVPAAIVAIAVGAKGLNVMLVASQVLLSVVLPTVIFPLVFLCSQKEIMVVQGPAEDATELEPAAVSNPLGTSATGPNTQETTAESALSNSCPEIETERRNPSLRCAKSYVSPKWVTILGYLLFGVVVIANGYVIVELCRGHGG